MKNKLLINDKIAMATISVIVAWLTLFLFFCILILAGTAYAETGADVFVEGWGGTAETMEIKADTFFDEQDLIQHLRTSSIAFSYADRIARQGRVDGLIIRR